jgi:hypothetical protein
MKTSLAVRPASIAQSLERASWSRKYEKKTGRNSTISVVQARPAELA